MSQPQVGDQLASPELPALPLSELRGLAEQHQLQTTLVRVGNTSWVTLHEPEAPTTPVLSAATGQPSVVLSGTLDIPAERAEHELANYRTAVPRELISNGPAVQQWAARTSQLAGHLLDERRDDADPTRAAFSASLTAASRGQDADAEHYLTRAEVVAEDLRPAPPRAAQIEQAVDRYAGTYLNSPIGSPESAARYVIEAHVQKTSPVAVTSQDWDYAAHYANANPEQLRTPNLAPHKAAQHDRADRDTQGTEAQRLVSTAYQAHTAGDTATSHQWLDAAELAAPHLGERVATLRSQLPPPETQPEAEPSAAEPGHDVTTTEPSPQPDASTEPAGPAQLALLGNAVPLEKALQNQPQPGINTNTAAARGSDPGHTPGIDR